MNRMDPNNEDARHFLRKLLLHGEEELLAGHQWPYEVDRWKELVFALLAHTTRLSQHQVRLLTAELLQLELLEISSLTALLEGTPPRLESGRPHAVRIQKTLAEAGIPEKEAILSLTTICEAALALESQFSGKVQMYLRSYGNRMVSEAQTLFRFSLLDRSSVETAFTLWLQNVLHMPVSLRDPALEAVCRAHGVDTRQLFAAADELDINVALVDDLLQQLASSGGVFQRVRHASPDSVPAPNRKAPAEPAAKG